VSHERLYFFVYIIRRITAFRILMLRRILPYSMMLGYINVRGSKQIVVIEKNSEEPTLISSHNITRIDTGCKILVFAKEHETIFNLHQHHQKLNYSCNVMAGY
jgi:hypothetical protein